MLNASALDEAMIVLSRSKNAAEVAEAADRGIDTSEALSGEGTTTRYGNHGENGDTGTVGSGSGGGRHADRLWRATRRAWGFQMLSTGLQWNRPVTPDGFSPTPRD